MNNRIYLDNAATTQLRPEVLEVMLPYLQHEYGNPSSVYQHGRTARTAIENAREKVATLFDAEVSEIVFTSGGTEANNTVIRTTFRHGQQRNRNRMVSSRAEHHAVLRPLEMLRTYGVETDFAPVDAGAGINVEALRELVRSETALVSCMHVNNETGGINDIATVADIAKEHGALFHTDAVQSAGKQLLSSRTIPFDFASASAHKIHGPKGIGALYVRKGIQFEPLIQGGSQERGRRGGTENTALVVGFGEAARIALETRDALVKQWNVFRKEMLADLRSAFPFMHVNEIEGQTQPNIVSVTFPSSHYTLDGEIILMNLDLAGLEISNGSACTAGSIETSHVMKTLGYDVRSSRATFRISFGALTKPEEVSQGAHILCTTIQESLQRQMR